MKLVKYMIITCISLCLAFSFSVTAFGYTWASRISGDDRYKTSVAISRTGWQSSENIVLATGENFPDAMCAVPLAKLLGAPVLLTGKDALNSDTEKEIERLKAANIYIIGGPAVISGNVESYLKEKGLSCVRIFGNDRYETSVALANYMASNFSISSEAVLVNGDDFSDALSVSSAAAKKNMPVLLASSGYISQSSLDFIKDKGINKVYVIGDDSIIGDEIIKGIPGVDRISGGDRYQRNTVILSSFEKDLDFSTIYIATGENFPDALAISSLASKNASPVVFVNHTLSDTARSFIESRLPAIKSAVAVGGSNVVSDSVLESIARESLNMPSGSNIKPYDELGSYLMDNISQVSFSDQSTLNLGKITVSQDNSSDCINIYLDMYPESYNNLVSYLNMGGSSAKQNVELWMRVIGNITAIQYPGKTVKGSLWYIESFTERPSSIPTEDLKYDPETGKWSVMHDILDFTRSVDGQYEMTWGK